MLRHPYWRGTGEAVLQTSGLPQGTPKEGLSGRRGSRARARGLARFIPSSQERFATPSGRAPNAVPPNSSVFPSEEERW